jgi:hypothetical protein
MSKQPKGVPGVLEADGVTIRLDARLGLPPGRVSVAVSPEDPSTPPPRPRRPTGLVTDDGQPTARYAAYLKYREKYAKAKEEYDAAYAAALADPTQLQLWPLRGAGYQAAVDAASREWTSLGFKDEIDRQLAGGK